MSVYDCTKENHTSTADPIRHDSTEKHQGRNHEVFASLKQGKLGVADTQLLFDGALHGS